MRLFCIAVSASLLFFLSCEEDKLPELSEVRASDIFSVTIDTSEVREADGYSYYEVVAEFKEKVRGDKQKVNFTTTIGEFPNGKASIEISANEVRKATTYLSSDSTGKGMVKAIVDNKYIIEYPIQFVNATNEIGVEIQANPDTAVVPEADGISYYELVVTFNGTIPQELKKVHITTTLGQFSNGSETTDLVPDLSHVATTRLKSETIGTAIVQIGFGEKIISEHHLEFAIPSADFELVVDSISVPADNIATHRIEVHFTKFSAPADRKIKLETDKGTFTNGEKSIDLLANSENIATTFLKSDESGAATVKGTYANEYSQETVVNFVVPAPDFEFNINNTVQIEADGYSTSRIEVLFTNFGSIAERSIELETTLGTFTNGEPKITILAGSDNKAVTFLKSTAVGSAVIKGTFAQKYSQETFVSFRKALPDAIYLTAPGFSLKSGLQNDITFETILTRQHGKPSEGFLLRYEAVDTLNASLGSFINNLPSTSEGKATIKYSAGPETKPSGEATYRGKVKITAFLQTEDEVLKDSVFIYVID